MKLQSYYINKSAKNIKKTLIQAFNKKEEEKKLWGKEPGNMETIPIVNISVESRPKKTYGYSTF